MKLRNVAPIKVGQYARYCADTSWWYIWKCTNVRRSDYGWHVHGIIVRTHGLPAFRVGEDVSGYWCESDTILTEEEVNEITQSATV